MINLKLCFLLLAVTTIESLWAYECGNSTIKRVSDGQDVQRMAWPWMTFIQSIASEVHMGNGRIQSKGFNCGGSLINDQWVLTAAHCVVDEKTNVKYKKYTLTFGEHNINDKYNPDKRIRFSNYDNVFVYDGYDGETVTNDIALIKLDKPLRLDDRDKHLQPICLPPTVNAQYANNNCTLTGWGETQSGQASDILQELDVIILSPNVCKSKYQGKYYDENTKLCVEDDGLTRFSGHGDSGGPLNCQLASRAWVVQGIVSYTSKQDYSIGRKNLFDDTVEIIGTKRIKLPDVYTSVVAYIPWIKRITGMK